MSSESNEILYWLQNWYANQCNGDWEHQQGVLIETVDNPGWYVTIDLMETAYENIPFQKRKVDRNEYDWYFCLIRNCKFEASCSPNNLVKVLKIFKAWIEENSTML